VVVAARHLADVPPHRLAAGEVHGRAGRCQDFAGGDQGLVHRQVEGAVQLQLVIQDRAGAGQVPVAVLAQVHGGRLIGAGGELEGQVPGLAQADRRLDPQVPGVAFLTVLADEAQDQAGGVGLLEGPGFPHRLVERLDAPVQVVGPVVAGQLVAPALDAERAPGDAVGIAPSSAPK